MTNWINFHEIFIIVRKFRWAITFFFISEKVKTSASWSLSSFYRFARVMLFSLSAFIRVARRQNGPSKWPLNSRWLCVRSTSPIGNPAFGHFDFVSSEKDIHLHETQRKIVHKLQLKLGPIQMQHCVSLDIFQKGKRLRSFYRRLIPDICHWKWKGMFSFLEWKYVCCFKSFAQTFSNGLMYIDHRLISTIWRRNWPKI